MNLYQEMGRFVAIPEGFLCDDITLLSKMIYTTMMAFTDKDFKAFPSMKEYLPDGCGLFIQLK